jgi:hypothetical protein
VVRDANLQPAFPAWHTGNRVGEPLRQSVGVKEVIPIPETALITAIVGILGLMLSFGTLVLKIVELVIRSK